jgi:6-phosphogluconate dehydrogenase
MDIEVPLPTIDAAVAMRDMSKINRKELRLLQIDWNAKQIDTDLPSAIEALKEALHFSILITYAQGFIVN